MPVGVFEREVLKLLAANRNPDSYVGGATVLNQSHLNHANQPVCPDPAAPGFAKLTRHFGSVKGAWPRILEN